MLLKGVKPDTHLYNLMLFVIKECGIGDQHLVEQMLTPINPATTRKLFKETDKKIPDSIETLKVVNVSSKSVNDQSTENVLTSMDKVATLEARCDEGTPNDNVLQQPSTWPQLSLPNVLNVNSEFSSVMSVGSISSAVDRFAMVGGMKGFLQDMENHGVKPNQKTFNQILPLIEPEEEQELLVSSLCVRRRRRLSSSSVVRRP